MKRSPKETAKLIDVARLAGVSTATVSRALSNPELVSDVARNRIEAAVRELRYVPHGAARALRSQRTRAIGAIVPTLGNAIFAQYIQALQNALQDRGYRLLLACNEYDPQTEERIVEPLIEHGIDGLVLVGYDHSHRLYRKIAHHRLPYVLTWTSGREGDKRPCIGFRNEDAAARVANYLADLQHVEFGMIAGIQKGNDRARERVTGVQHALAARGLAFRRKYLLERPYTFTAGREAMRHLMTMQPRPTAVICGNDVLAVGALTECHALGIKVPDDVSIVGFDDMELASITLPPLTTVRVPSEQLGEMTANYIVECVEGEKSTVTPMINVDLVVRSTTGPAPTRNPRVP